MTYARQQWNDFASGGTPLSAARLNHVEAGVEEAHRLHDEGWAAFNDAYIATLESTTSDSFVDLSTVGPEASVTIGQSGKVLVIISGSLGNSTSGAGAVMSWEAIGPTGISPSSRTHLTFHTTTSTMMLRASKANVFAGLQPGSYVFRAKYRRVIGLGGTASFEHREIIAVPIP